MGRTRGAGATAAVPSAGATADGYEFRGGARVGDDETADPNYSYSLIEGVDPDVYDLCIEYEIEDRRMHKLHWIMQQRSDTFESDMLKLWDSVKNAREPNTILGAKMRDMERGTFIGKAPMRYIKASKHLRDFFKKYSIDNLCKDSISDALYDRRLRIIRERKLRGGGKDGDGYPDKDLRNIIDRLDRSIEGSRNPSALVMKEIPKIEQGLGKWEGVGQLEKAREAPIEKVDEVAVQKAVGISKDELRAEDDRIAEKEGKVKKPKFKQEVPVQKGPPPLAEHVPSNAEKAILGGLAFTIVTNESQPRPSTAPAFDSKELAKRLSKAEMKAELPWRSAAPEPGAIIEPQAAALAPRPPSPLPPMAAPPPEPPKRNLVPLKLSKKSVELLTKPQVVPGTKESKDDSAASMSDLEMASMALGRPIEELKKVPKDELRAMIFAKMNNPSPSSSRSPSRSPSAKSEEGGDMANMSDLEMASVVLRRPKGELSKLPPEEVKRLVFAKMNAPPSPGGSASRSPSPAASAEPSRASRSRSRAAPSGTQATGKEQSDRAPDRSKSRHKESLTTHREKYRSRGEESRSPEASGHARGAHRSGRHSSQNHGSSSRDVDRKSRRVASRSRSRRGHGR